MRTRSRVLAALFLCTLSQGGAHAFGCPEDQYEQCTPLGCICLPKIGGAVGQGAEHLKRELQGQTGGPALEIWLNGSRNTAIGTSSPIPFQIRQALTGYIDDDVMNRARFKVGDNGVLNLAGLSLAYGDVFGNSVAAVTLIDVIVFRNLNDAFGNPSLWAHELTHVKQFRDWGTRDFAISYVRDSGSVEGPAYAVGNNYSNWLGSRVNRQTPVPGLVPAPVGLPSGYGMQTCACVGANPAPASEPRCQTGVVRPNVCAGVCPGGYPPFAFVCQ